MKRDDNDLTSYHPPIAHPPFAPGVVEGPARRRIDLGNLIVGTVGLLACTLVFTGVAAALGWLLYQVLR